MNMLEYRKKKTKKKQTLYIKIAEKGYYRKTRIFFTQFKNLFCSYIFFCQKYDLIPNNHNGLSKIRFYSLREIHV